MCMGARALAGKGGDMADRRFRLGSDTIDPLLFCERRMQLIEH